MEHYIKVEKGCLVNSQIDGKVYVINVTDDSKFYQEVRNVCKCLKQKNEVFLVGEGSVSHKVVAIAEKVKETLLDVCETIDIYDTEYKDFWIPKNDNLGLGKLEVIRAVPTTKILLKQEINKSQELKNSSKLSQKMKNQPKTKRGTEKKEVSKSRENNHNGKASLKSNLRVKEKSSIPIISSEKRHSEKRHGERARTKNSADNKEEQTVVKADGKNFNPNKTFNNIERTTNGNQIRPSIDRNALQHQKKMEKERSSTANVQL